MNEYYRQSRLFSRYGFPVMLCGTIDLVAPVKASLVTQGLTLTAVGYGVAQQAITLAITGGGTAGSEVVTVTGNAISVKVQSGVSTVTQVRTAMQASGPCTALVTTTGTSASTVSTAAAIPLAGAVEAVSAFNIGGVASVLQDPANAGTYNITLSQPHKALMSAQFTLRAATASDLVPQMKSDDVVSAKLIVLRLNVGGTPTDPAAATRVYCDLRVNDSTIGINN